MEKQTLELIMNGVVFSGLALGVYALPITDYLIKKRQEKINSRKNNNNNNPQFHKSIINYLANYN